MSMNAPTAQPVVAAGSSRAQLVLAGGLLLIVASIIAGPATRTILINVFKSPGNATQLATNTQSVGLIDLGAELLLVLVLYVVASVSDAAGALAVAILAAMWLVFFLRYADLLGLGTSTTQQRA